MIQFQKNTKKFVVIYYLLSLSLFNLTTGYTSRAIAAEMHGSRISEEVIPVLVDKVPDRPRPLLEIGDPLLATGPIQEGFTIPTGAVWQPSFIMFGTYRSAFQTFYNGRDDTSEWANRFDLFGNLYLTQTERILAGVRFLDDSGRFTGYTFKAPGIEDDWDEELDFDIETLFFEGDFGEIFPMLDPQDKYGLDFGFAVGRQLIEFQGGMLINDNIDSLGITKINLKPRGVVNMRSTFIWGTNQINRKNLIKDDNDSNMYGLFNEIDTRSSTISLDVIYMDADRDFGSGLFAALSAIQRLGEINTTFRILGSAPTSTETDHNTSGILLFSEISWQPKGTHNHVYINAFRGFDKFRSASRDTLAGGPLGQTGVLFEAVGIGRYGSALSNDADNAFGGAVGYQMFSKDKRKNLTIEVGGRYATENVGQRAVGVGANYEMAVGKRTRIRIGTYAVYDPKRNIETVSRDDYRYGARLEFIINF